MNNVLKIFSVLLFVSYPFKTLGYYSINCRILSLLINDIDESRKSRIKEVGSDLTDSIGQVTRVVDSIHRERIPVNERVRSKIVLVDTFGFFIANNCPQFEVINKILNQSKSSSSSYYYITGVATGRKDALAIGISRSGSSKQTVYYISVKGDFAEILEKYETAIGE